MLQSIGVPIESSPLNCFSYMNGVISSFAKLDKMKPAYLYGILNNKIETTLIEMKNLNLTVSSVRDGFCFQMSGTTNELSPNKLNDVYLAKIDVINRLNGFSKLKRNWDCYDAEEISQDVISIAISLINDFQVIPEVFPTSDGGVQFQFTNDNEDYLEVELNPDRSAGLFLESSQEEITLDLTKPKDIRCLIGKVDVFGKGRNRGFLSRGEIVSCSI